MFAELINDGDVDLNVTKVVLNSLRVWEDMNGGMVLQANNITADNLDIFVKADHYVEYTFNLNITNAQRRYFEAPIKWNFNYNIFWNQAEVQDFETGYVPPPMDMSHLARNPPKNVTKRTFASKIPAVYDMRNTGKLTPVKDQKPYGTCWAHAAMGRVNQII